MATIDDVATVLGGLNSVLATYLASLEQRIQALEQKPDAAAVDLPDTWTATYPDGGKVNYRKE